MDTPQPAPRDGLAHVAGSTERPLLELTLPALFKQTVKNYADSEACVFHAQQTRLSYSELDAQVDRLAAGLLAVGLYKGDRVGIWAPNRLEWLITQLATARLGLILVNINPAYRTSELEFALNKVAARALITSRQFKKSNYITMLRELAPELDSAVAGRLRAARLPALRSVIQTGPNDVKGMFSFDQILTRAAAGNLSRLDAISGGLNPDDIINIQFTSGTTGAPKGASRATVSLLWHGTGQPRLHRKRRHHGFSRRRFRRRTDFRHH